eukprot:3052681-Rhodomonas_salina.3
MHRVPSAEVLFSLCLVSRQREVAGGRAGGGGEREGGGAGRNDMIVPAYPFAAIDAKSWSHCRRKSESPRKMSAL